MRQSIQNHLLCLLLLRSDFVTIGVVLLLIRALNPYVQAFSKKRILLIRQTLKTNTDRLIISGTGVLIALQGESAIKVPLCDQSADSLEKEYDAYSLLFNSNLREIVDYQLTKKSYAGSVFYRVDRLNYQFRSEKIALRVVLDKLKLLRQVEDKNTYFFLPKQILGLEVLVKNSPASIQYRLVELANKLRKYSCHVCPMHGDLTPLNMMSNAGAPVLIDLDRFDFHGLPFIDPLHFRIEKEAKSNEVNSYDKLFEICSEEEADLSQIASYLFYRIGAEYKNGVRYSRNYYLRAIKVALYIEDHGLC